MVCFMVKSVSGNKYINLTVSAVHPRRLRKGMEMNMKEQKMDQNIIECMLTLLKHPENNNISLEHPADGAHEDVTPEMQNSFDIRTVRGLIKLMDEMPGGFLIYHADAEEEIIYANKALLRIFQCDTYEEFKTLTGNTFKGLVYSEDRDAVEESIREQIANSQYDLDYVEYRIVRKDGEMRLIEDYGHFVHTDSVGDIFYVFLGDATEKRARLQTESTKKEQKLQSMLDEYAKEQMLTKQEYQRRMEVIEGLSANYETILYADIDLDQILPYRLSSRTEVQFEKVFQPRSYSWFTTDYLNMWVHPEDREHFTEVTSPAYIREKLAESKTFYINYRVLENNEVQYLQLRIANVGNKENISQIVMGYRRVDEEIMKEMEQQQELEKALENVKLAIMAKNSFLSNMSHDMRTPLNAIFGYTALAQKNAGDCDAMLNYLDKIEVSGRQLLDLIDKVLEIAWSESNSVQLVEDECNLCDILEDVHNDLLNKVTEKNISFYLSLAGLEHCDIYSDREKLKQLLLYLTNNAVTYTQNNGRVDLIVMELSHLPNDYTVYQFIVRDTGIGISEEFIKRIFEPFERENNTTLSGIHGAGLGLTIAKNIVDMMGGEIEVESFKGVGSTFTVTLKFRLQEQQFHSSESPVEDVVAQLLDQKILLVDDNEINLEIESEILKGLGFSTDTALDGSIAIEMVRNSKPGEYGLILMDIQMPGVDGWQATKAIRKLENPRLASIPIIALSANAFESDKRESIESGMDAHLAKPIDIPLLVETLEKTVARKMNG